MFYYSSQYWNRYLQSWVIITNIPSYYYLGIEYISIFHHFTILGLILDSFNFTNIGICPSLEIHTFPSEFQYCDMAFFPCACVCKCVCACMHVQVTGNFPEDSSTQPGLSHHYTCMTRYLLH